MALALFRFGLPSSLTAATLLCVAGCGDGLESRIDPNQLGGSASCAAQSPCTIPFTYPLQWPVSQTVELRGDFKEGGWESGVPLQVDGVQWRAEVSLAEGTVVAYKFLLGGADWVLDPNNTETVPDGSGGDASVLTVQCALAACAQ